jgi:hypothetical protein
MRLVARLFALGWIGLGLAPLFAQISQPLLPLELQGDPRDTQLPPYSVLGVPQCDSSGQIYVRYSGQAENVSPSKLAVVEPDGSTQTLSLASVSGADEDHVFLFAAGNDGTLHEILRVVDPGDRDEPATDIRYATFDNDGALQSKADFGKEFIPSLLLPLPSGNFFASGVNLSETKGEISEAAMAGIFNSDAVLLRKLKKDPSLLRAAAHHQGADPDSIDTTFDGGIVKLGTDGNIYVLLPGDYARIAVVTQAGHIIRETKLQEPFESDVAHDMWISGNRILVVYEGEADDPKDAYVYVLYDAQSGEVVRAYHPQFSGTVACFEDGQTISLLLRQPSSGKIQRGTAQMQ